MTAPHIPPTSEELRVVLRNIDKDDTAHHPQLLYIRCLIREIQRLREECKIEANTLDCELSSRITPVRAVLRATADRLRAAAEGQ
jgi:hypothetical protein